MISDKQKKILAFPYSKYECLICDGAVRSGKTSLMMVSFVRWAMENFSGQRFGICGKTVDSATKNIIVPFLSMNYAKQRYTLKWRRSDKLLEARRGTAVNYFEVFGGKDEASFMLIQGRTLAGVLLDEVVLMPESFVNQALARCSVDGARLWFSCNPGNPSHWFKTGWIDDLERHNALYLHFSMRDNPSLGERTLRRYETMYSGVFYDRYVRGLWVAAEGLVYPMFDESEHIIDALPWQAAQRGRYYISVDYGTVNPTAALLWCVYKGVGYCISEYYYDTREKQKGSDYMTLPRRTDEKHYEAIERLADGYGIDRIIVDPSAASLKEVIREHGKFSVWNADNSVIDGIRVTASLLEAGRLKFLRGCTATIGEFGKYLWNEDSAEDEVIKENDHAMDSMRYFCMSILRRE